MSKFESQRVVLREASFFFLYVLAWIPPGALDVRTQGKARGTLSLSHATGRVIFFAACRKKPTRTTATWKRRCGTRWSGPCLSCWRPSTTCWPTSATTARRGRARRGRRTPSRRGATAPTCRTRPPTSGERPLPFPFSPGAALLRCFLGARQTRACWCGTAWHRVVRQRSGTATGLSFSYSQGRRASFTCIRCSTPPPVAPRLRGMRFVGYLGAIPCPRAIALPCPPLCLLGWRSPSLLPATVLFTRPRGSAWLARSLWPKWNCFAVRCCCCCVNQPFGFVRGSCRRKGFEEKP